MTTLGLTRLVVFAPRRRLDLAFPNQLPVASLLPSLLRHAGEHLADQGVPHGGWVVRRADGSALDPGASFAAQQVHDGEQLHLLPRQAQWPDLAYDDIVDAIATGTRRRGRQWDGSATRTTGLALAALSLTAGLTVAMLSGPPWTVTAALVLALAGILLLAGTVRSRALGDGATGAVVAAAAMPYALAGGALLLAVTEPLSRLGAPHLLSGSALLLAAGVAGHLGVGMAGRLFVAGVTAGACGIVGAGTVLLFPAVDGPAAAAIVAGVVLLFSPMLPAVAVRVGRVPLPDLPRTPEDLVADLPQPDRRTVEAATARADEVLTGALFGAAAVTLGCSALLVTTGRTGAVALAAVTSAALLLRARFHASVRHRVPLLVAGAGGLAVAAVGAALAAGPDRMPLVLPALAGVAGLALAAGLTYRRRSPSPRLGRFADILDVLLTLAVVPLVGGVLGVYASIRGLGG